jgi:hypothetical protein
MSDKQVKQARKQVTTIRDYRQVFSSQAGKRVLHDLMSAHHMLGTSFVVKSELETVFNEGQRNVVLRILAKLNTNPEELEKHIEEYERDARSE